VAAYPAGPVRTEPLPNWRFARIGGSVGGQVASLGVAGRSGRAPLALGWVARPVLAVDCVTGCRPTAATAPGAPTLAWPVSTGRIGVRGMLAGSCRSSGWRTRGAADWRASPGAPPGWLGPPGRVRLTCLGHALLVQTWLMLTRLAPAARRAPGLCPTCRTPVGSARAARTRPAVADSRPAVARGRLLA
jgi:hypothetical protein